MKVIGLSDLHGELPKITEKFDLMLICGDVCPAYNHSADFQEEWIKVVFSKWIYNLPFKGSDSRVVMIAGNHDFVFERYASGEYEGLLRNMPERFVYLNNEEYDFKNEGETYRIFGTPYCKKFFNWAFMPDTKEELEEKLSKIPDGLDFLISHDAADINELGLIKEGRYAGTNAGSPILAKYIKLRRPRYYLCGHIHSGNHNFEEIDGTFMANVSYVDESYNPKHKHLSFNVVNTYNK